jgi:AcrR family transcriptional regulator
LKEHGEQGLRITDLVKTTGCSTGSLYHYFGSRDGIIEAARAYQYAQAVPAYGSEIVEMTTSATTAKEFTDLLVNVIRDVQSADRAPDRLGQAEFLGSAVARPDLFDALKALQTSTFSESEEVARILIERGWVREGISPRALAMFSLAVGFGRIVGDLDLEPVDPEEWVRIVDLATRGLLNLGGENDT